MVTRKKNKKSLKYRVAAVVIDGERVLLHRCEGDDFWYLPGGKVEPMEIGAEAVAREMREELGQPVEVTRLLWVVENFFQAGHKKHIHEIGLYFLVRLPPGSPYLAGSGPFERYEDGDHPRLLFQWFPLEAPALAAVDLRPAFLRRALLDISDEISYIVVQGLPG